MLILGQDGDRTMTTTAGGMRLLRSMKSHWPKPGVPGLGTGSVMDNIRGGRRAMGVYLGHRTLRAPWRRRARKMDNLYQVPAAHAPGRDSLGTNVRRLGMNIRLERGATGVCLARRTPPIPWTRHWPHRARGRSSSRQLSAVQAQTRAWAQFHALDHEQHHPLPVRRRRACIHHRIRPRHRRPPTPHRRHRLLLHPHHLQLPLHH